jgi:hypothetical protein
MKNEKMRQALGKVKEHMGDVSFHHVVLVKAVKCSEAWRERWFGRIVQTTASRRLIDRLLNLK